MTQQTSTLSAPLAQRKKIGFWLVLFLLFVIISAAFTEIVLRVLYREQDAIGSYFGAGAYVQDDLAGYRHTPGFQSEVYRRGAFVCRINIDQNGLRQSNFDAQRQYPKRVLLPADRWLPIAPIDFLRTRSYAWLIMETAWRRKKIEASNGVFTSLARDSTEQVVQPTVEALATLQNFCRKNNIQLGVMMIPQFGKAGIFDAPLKRALSAAGVPVLDLAEKKSAASIICPATRIGMKRATSAPRNILRPFATNF